MSCYYIKRPWSLFWRGPYKIDEIIAALEKQEISKDWLASRDQLKISTVESVLAYSKREQSENTKRNEQADKHQYKQEEDSNQNQRPKDADIKSPDLHYAKILELKGRVSRDDIKKRYRELANQYHPDKVTHLGPKLRKLAEDEMQQINEAFDYFRKKFDIQ